MSLLWPEGLPLTVECAGDATPLRLRLQGGWHTVAVVSARWRVRQGWWRAGYWREYVTVATHGRLLLTLARDLPAGTWRLVYLHD
ncbi:MAG: hypothetical protein N2378_04655 [Chloroflexaceae bacterium]|nr:hypothetical protein [Chloroflexaceae bacterium]